MYVVFLQIDDLIHIHHAKFQEYCYIYLPLMRFNYTLYAFLCYHYLFPIRAELLW